ncbi:SOS response-associated peptidase [Thalassovita mangrovi]|uniref:Abasic site processing protein n=1 Tax=Thalassovita mangrovi TaxID=2692236 RepID=A0A6L8LQF2_9RHOB|nr:SOS response-associated peptidase [Thalassovita mangrovi]MYM55762.1 SOS response-associated peptidase [Thalassovita mangrovi]
MCGRFVAAEGLTWAQIYAIQRGFLDAGGALKIDDAPAAAQGFNIKPTQQVAIAFAQGNDLVASSARWWFVPHWHKGDVADWKATTFNAKIETAAEKPTFRDAWKTGRCLIPARGYYEWTGKKGDKQPWFIAPLSNEPAFFFAGLASTLQNGLRTCTLLTRPAAPEIAHIHSRMPVMLRDDQVVPWLRQEMGEEEARDTLGIGWNFRAHTVRRFGLQDDGPELIEPDGLAL